MLKDSKLVWIAEYVIGIAFLTAVMPFIIYPQPGWSSAHGWAYLLFIACAGITLLSSASATRQRMNLAQRIAKLEQMVDEQKSSGSQTHDESGKQFITREYLVGSVN